MIRPLTLPGFMVYAPGMGVIRPFVPQWQRDEPLVDHHAPRADDQSARKRERRRLGRIEVSHVGSVDLLRMLDECSGDLSALSRLLGEHATVGHVYGAIQARELIDEYTAIRHRHGWWRDQMGAWHNSRVPRCDTCHRHAASSIEPTCRRCRRAM